MGNFIFTCPQCYKPLPAKTGLFAPKRMTCTCGHEINLKTDTLATIQCPSCNNFVVYDQKKGSNNKCPVCQSNLVSDGTQDSFVSFHCSTCNGPMTISRAAQSVVCPLCGTEADVQAEVKKAEIRKKAIPSVLKYEGDNKTFVWKHPVEDFVSGSQLIVHENQEAIFFRNGQALDSFTSGRYDLETSVMPKMANYYKNLAEGQPFHAEVYFVNLSTQMEIKWGTPSKVHLFDPATGLTIELGASGAFNIHVSDARKLLVKVVGTEGSLKQEDLFQMNGNNSGFFRTMIVSKVKNHLARSIKENGINVLELDENIDLISNVLKEAINKELDAYGLQMSEFYISTFVTPDDDPNFMRLKQQHADRYLKTQEERIRREEAAAAYERKSVEAQTEAALLRIKAQAEADALRLKAEAEAQEMRMKGYTYQEETARQIGLEAMKNSSGAGSIASDAMKLGVGLGTIGSVMGMTKEAIQTTTTAASPIPPKSSGWNCSCGRMNIDGRFCPDCGNKKPEEPKGWNCSCGRTNITSLFCPDCGTRRPEENPTWTCSCGRTGITSAFCPDCGNKRG